MSNVRMFFSGIVFVFTLYACSLSRNTEYQIPYVYRAYCRHTQSVASVHFKADSTFYFNTGSFMKNTVYYGKYTISIDTITVKFNEPEAQGIFSNGLLITKKGIVVIGDTIGHNHLFLFNIDCCD